MKATAEAVALKRPRARTTPALRAAGDAKRTTRLPLILAGVQPGKKITIQPQEFGRVDIDKRYQRDRIDQSVNDLIYVLQHGGDVPDPITVVQRLFREGGERSPSDKFWIIDGQQRFMAHLELNRPIEAMAHGVDSFEAERAFFLVMNTRRAVNANTFVHSWPGPTAELLRTVDRSPTHSLYGRVNFGNGGNERISAAILAKGMLAVLARNVKGRIDHSLNRADSALRAGRPDQIKAEAFLSLCGRVFPRGYAHTLAVQALGTIASERWVENTTMPSATVIERLRRVNWRAEVPSFAERFRPIIEGCVRRIWR